MINIRGLAKSYAVGKNHLNILKGIDLHIGAGEFVAIMGSSGSGKSTLMNIMGLLDSYHSGSYQLSGQDMANLSAKKAAWYRNQMIGFVFQSSNLLHFKSATENVALPLFYRKISRSKRNRAAREILEKVGLGHRVDHRPSELSGGECQRVAIARALVGNPKVILADEPTGALDSKTTYEIMSLFKDMGRPGKTMVIVTHEEEIAKQADRIIRMKDGLLTAG